MTNHFGRACLLLLCLSVIGQAEAQDAGLYGKVMDPMASFVRVVSLEAPASVIGGTSVNSQQGISPYVNVEPGKVEISAGTRSSRVDVEPGSFYTLAVTASGARVFKDDVKNDPAKAQVYLYNLSDLDGVDLFVPAAKVAAVEAVPSGSSKDVALRAPLSLAFEIRKDGRALAPPFTIDLKRRSGYTVILSGTAGKYGPVVVENNLLQP